ncbi:hypothetical protein QBC39DRAFT_408031 [Podospora conica]|nr:hypothetical protein QBC39DRAFT_408031 [Schizothecium conicum]
MKLSTVLWPLSWAAVLAQEQPPSLASLTANLLRAESVREVKNLQKTYAQLAAHAQWNEMAALFADDGILRWGQGKPGANILSDSDAVNATGPVAIAAYLKTEAGDFDGQKPGGMHVLINEQPVVTLSEDGKTANGRWNVIRYLGDGAGKTKIDGGHFENVYVLNDAGRWKIKLLRYYPGYEGTYKDGWSNVGKNNLPVVPYHYTPDSAGIPILSTAVVNETSSLSIDKLDYRITRLNDEDAVRNLQHTAGYYVDRRMWPDVVDLFTADGTISVDGQSSDPGPAGIQNALNQMGPEGLTQGILNEHPIYQMTVAVNPNGREATSRGLEIGMIGDHTNKQAEWQFCLFQHTYIKDPSTGIWKIAHLSYTRLMTASYSSGWATGGLLPRNRTITPPPLLDILGPPHPTTDRSPTARPLPAGLLRRLSRSTAWDETENISSAYGYYADDIRCFDFAALHAAKGFKMSPGVGWYLGPSRIGQACAARYGGNGSSSRGSVPFHWRIQPVILVSDDGRSATARIRNLQHGTSKGTGAGWNGGMYHDQFVLEEQVGGGRRRKLWCLTIDEFYWSSASWKAGWAGVEGSTAVGRRQGGSIGGLVADVGVMHPGLTTRETGFNGGPPPTVRWPGIQRMWWGLRNPVSGRVPESYWPGCVPCVEGVKPEWALTANGYQEPETGPGQ